MNYIQIYAVAEEDAARFQTVMNYERNYMFLEGVPLKDSFPAEAAYRMDDEFPDCMALYDALWNCDAQLIVSARVRTFLEQEGVQHIEFLPVRVLNHKDREVKGRYFIVNMHPLVDCIDKSKTQFEWSPLNEEKMMDVTNLTLVEERIPADFKLLRLRNLPSVVLIQRDLAQKMNEARFRGLETREIADYEWD